MAIAFGILFIVLGLFFITPVGAAMGARYNTKHAGDRFQDGTTKAKTVPGMMLTGAIFLAAGIYLVVQQA